MAQRGRPDKIASPSDIQNSLSPEEQADTWVWDVRNDRERVILDPNGGSITGTATNDLVGTTQGDSIVFDEFALPNSGSTTAARPGYVLMGWNTEPDGSGDDYPLGTSYQPTGGKVTTLYAQWVAEDQVPHLIVQHYKQHPTTGALPGKLVEETETIVMPDVDTVAPVNTYEGYTSPAAQTVSMPAGSTRTVIYQYLAKPYTVAYDGNGATSGNVRQQQVSAGRAFTVAANKFERDGYVFTGWSTAQDASASGATAYLPGQTLGAGSSLAAPGQTVTLYAQWTKVSNTPLQPVSGEVTFKLKAGQTVVFDNLPPGVSYEIVETNLPSGWSIESATGETPTGNTVGGVAEAADADEATFVNRYDAEGSVAVQAQKKLVGATAQDGQFTFQVTNPTAASGSLDAANAGEDSATGMAPILFPDIAFTLAGIAADVAAGKATPVVRLSDEDAAASAEGDIILDDATYRSWNRDMDDYPHPTGWIYSTTVSEVAGTDSAITYSNEEATVRILVVDNGDGRLVPTVLYHELATGANPEGDIVFTNYMNPGGLTLAKTLVNTTPLAAQLNTFTFTVTLRDNADNPISGTFEAQLNEEPYGAEGTVAFDENGQATVELAGGEVLSIADLPHGATYTVVENAPGNGFTQTGSVGAEGAIEALATASASIENTYNAQGEAVIAVTKTLHSANPLREGQFGFMLLDDDLRVVARATNGAPTAVDQAAQTSTAPVEFGAVRFDLGDLYDGTGTLQTSMTRTYYVAEDNDLQDNISYDDALYKVEITFTDDGKGHLDTAVKYYDAQGQPTGNDGQDASGFVNKFILKMPATGMAGVTGTGLLLAILIGSMALVVRRRRLQMEAAAAARANARSDAKSQVLKAKDVQC